MNPADKKVLIVEDEEAMLDALANKFEKKGYTVLRGHDGEEGYKIASKEEPDLLILDIIMPKINGIELMEKIRTESDWGKEVPIIMLTNVSDPENVSRAAVHRVYDFLVKTDWRLDDVVKLAEEKMSLANIEES